MRGYNVCTTATLKLHWPNWRRERPFTGDMTDGKLMLGTSIADKLTIKGKYHALHYRCCFDHSMAAWIGELIYHGWLYTHSSGDRYRSCPAENHKRTQAIVTKNEETSAA